MILGDSMKKEKELKCPMCNSVISKKDERCPKCGSVLKKAYSKITKILYITTFFILILFLVILIGVIRQAILVSKMNDIKGTYRLTSENSEFREIMYFRKVNTKESWDNNEGSANLINEILVTYGVNIYNYNVGSEFKEKAFCFSKKENKLEQVKCPKIDIDLKEGEMLNLTYEKE